MSLPGGRLELAALDLLRRLAMDSVCLAVDCDPPGFQGMRWNRYAGLGAEPVAWPVGTGGLSGGLLRLNKARDANLYAIEGLRAALRSDAPIVLYGGNDEGIKSVRCLGSVNFEVVDSLGHGRLLRGVRGGAPTRQMADFVRRVPIHLPFAGERLWVSYPGCFAQGGLDAGTAHLLRSLTGGSRVPTRILDFACGTGVIAADVCARWPGVEVVGCDYDALAIAAARLNVPSANFVVGDGLACVTGRDFDLVLSNPPFHDGKVRSHRVWMGFVSDVRRLLRAGGELRVVAQREVPVEGPLRSLFATVERVVHHPRFAVWSAR